MNDALRKPPRRAFGLLPPQGGAFFLGSGPTAKIHLLRLAVLVSTLGLWEAGSRLHWWDSTWSSSPAMITRALAESLKTGDVLFHTYITLAEAFSGLVAGAAAGIVLGVVLGLSRVVGAVMEPFIIMLNSLPRIALAPLIVMYVGIGFMSKFLLSFSLVVVPMMLSTYEGIRSAQPIWLQTMRVLGASRQQVFLKVLLPNCVPWIFSSIRVCISLAIVGAIVGEFISARAGIGYMIDEAAGGFDITGMLMPLLVLMVLAFLLDRLVLAGSNRLMRWRDS